MPNEYECWNKYAPDIKGTYAGKTANEARYRAFLNMTDVGWDVEYIDMRSRKLGPWIDPRIEQQRIVDEFNAKYPVGTLIRYWEIILEDGTKPCATQIRNTRSLADLSPYGEPIIFLTGKAGWVLLKHVQPVRRETICHST